MNTLSWLIYLADVADSVAFSLTLILICFGIAAAGRVIKRVVDGDDEVLVPVWRAAWRPFLSLFLPIALALAVMPSASTVYAIAASEMGETALKSETGGKAVQALNAWLDRQIEGEKDGE